MQLLPSPTKKLHRVDKCARKVLEAAPPVVWFLRRHMWQHRRGLSVPQFRALCWVNRYPKATLASVASHLDGTLSTASRIVTGLVEQGLIKRTEGSDDRRQLALTITPRGRDVMSAAYAAAQDKLAEQLGGLTVAQAAALSSAMDLLFEKFAALDPDAASGADDDEMN